jgi:Toxin SymE, type I toxin-antitoxin system
MANTNDKPGRRARKAADRPLKQERFLTVSLYPETRPRSPWIRLRGLWLQQAGFTPQSCIRVRIMQGCLVITAEEPPPFP